MSTRSNDGSAVISGGGEHRYHLERNVNPFGEGICLFIMLNPSTADATKDDPTIRRCKSFADIWGYKRLTVVNLFAYRATDPRALWTASEPVGFLNNSWIKSSALKASKVVCAWGANGYLYDRDREVMALLKRVGVTAYCLNTTKDGFPCHPLYQPKDAVLKPYGGRT